MAQYRKIDIRIWNDKKFRQLDNTAKLVFLLLLTHPNMSMLGTLRGSKESLAYEIDVTPDVMSHAMTDVISHGMAYVDDMGLIFIPNFLKYNAPTSPQSLVNWDAIIENLPECDLKSFVCQRIFKYANEELSEKMRSKLSKEFWELIKNQSDSCSHDGMRDGIRDAIKDGINDGMRDGTTRACERAPAPDTQHTTHNTHINTNKQQTEVCNEEPAREDDVCSENFDDPLIEQAENLAAEQTQKVVDDPDAVVTPVQVIGLARFHGIKVARTIKLEQVCKQQILTVDNVRQCIRIAKKEQKGGPYLVGILANAVNEPNEYHTWEYQEQKRKEWQEGVDENIPF